MTAQTTQADEKTIKPIDEINNTSNYLSYPLLSDKSHLSKFETDNI